MAYTSCFRARRVAPAGTPAACCAATSSTRASCSRWRTGAQQAIACQEDVLARSESILRDLGLAYRVLDLCTGDLGASAARTWDIEAYAPGCDLWLEVQLGVVVRRLPGPPRRDPLPARPRARAPRCATR